MTETAANPHMNLAVLGYAAGFTLWRYRTDEPLSTVLADNYFGPMKFGHPRYGDFIMTQAGDEHAQLVVTQGGENIRTVAMASVRIGAEMECGMTEAEKIIEVVRQYADDPSLGNKHVAHIRSDLLSIIGAPHIHSSRGSGSDMCFCGRDLRHEIHH